ncbi:MAG: hypothetical protein OZ928_07445 [Polyangiaceae bacterium]|nr:hypothetical protein [Polyangiaceae bacterium]
MNKAQKWSLVTPVALGLLIPVVGTTYLGCKKDEPPPPLPSAAPAETPSAPLELAPEVPIVDAGEEEASKKATGPYKPAPSLQACCNALSQNAASAPDPVTKGYMLQAAGVCSAAVAAGKDKSSVVAMVAGALKGAGMPAACR